MHTKSKGCCHDQVTIVKIHDDHQTSSGLSSIDKIQPPITTLPEFLSAALPSKDVFLDKTDHSPPLLLSEQDVYIQNGVFRI